MKKMKLFLLAILFTASLHAQNDTAYFEDGSMVIGKGGIKVSIQDGNIVIDGSGIKRFEPGITAGPSTVEGSFPWRVWTDTVEWGSGALHVDDSTLVRKPHHPGSFELVIDPQDTIVVDPAEPSNELQKFRNGQWRKIEEQ